MEHSAQPTSSVAGSDNPISVQPGILTVAITGGKLESLCAFLRRLTGAIVEPRDLNLLAVGQDDDESSALPLHVFYDEWTRTQYLLVGEGDSLGEACKDLIGAELHAAVARAEFHTLIAQLIAFLACHGVLWIAEGDQPGPKLVAKLRQLQIAKQLIVPHAPNTGPSAARTRVRGGRGNRGRGGRGVKMGASVAPESSTESQSLEIPKYAAPTVWAPGAVVPQLLVVSSSSQLSDSSDSLDEQFQLLVRKARILPSDPDSIVSLFTMPSRTVYSVNLNPNDEGLMGAVSAAVTSLVAKSKSMEGGFVPSAESLALFDTSEFFGVMEPAFHVLRNALSACAACRRPLAVPVLFPASTDVWSAAVADWSAALLKASHLVDPLEAAELPRPRGGVESGRAFDFVVPQLNRCRDVAQWLGGCSAPELTASTVKCREAVEVALCVYSEDLPPAYAAALHLQRKAAALVEYETMAEGPAAESYRTALQQQCEDYWRNGKQLCGAVSLTGHQCTLPPHHLPPHALEDGVLVQPHCSGVSWMLASASGEECAWRNDAFDLDTANLPDPVSKASIGAEDVGGRNASLVPFDGVKVSALEGHMCIQDGTFSALAPARKLVDVSGSSQWIGVGQWWALACLRKACVGNTDETLSGQPGFKSTPTLLPLEIDVHLAEERRSVGKKGGSKASGQQNGRGGRGGGSGHQQQRGSSTLDESQFPTLAQSTSKQSLPRRDNTGNGPGKVVRGGGRTLSEADIEAVRQQLAQLWLSNAAPASDLSVSEPAASHTAGGRGGGRGRGRGGGGRGRAGSNTNHSGSSGSVAPPSTASEKHKLKCVLALGVEYQCGSGCRFLLSSWPPAKSTPAPDVGGSRNGRGGHRGSNPISIAPARQLLSSDLPLFLGCPYCGGGEDSSEGKAGRMEQELGGIARRPAHLAQLTRLFVRTPDAPFALSSRPIVHFHGPPPPTPPSPTLPSSTQPPVDPPVPPSEPLQLLSFSPAEAVTLPPGCFLALRFPLAYGVPSTDGDRPLSQAAAGWPYRAWLQKGTALFPTPPPSTPSANAPTPAPP